MNDPDLISAETKAMQRAMPMTRLLDCGMDYADAAALVARTSAGEKWDCVAEALAGRQSARATEAANAGFFITAREAREAAIGCLIFAQMAFNFDVPRKRSLYARVKEGGQELVAASGGKLQRIELPHAGSTLVGWLMRPAGSCASACVIVFGGQSGWGLAYLPAARALAARGIATLLAEGPGQGETRIAYGLHVDGDVPSAYTAFVQHLRNAHKFSSIGVWGNSFGGLWAAKAAAHDHRVDACCINGAFAAPQVFTFRTAAEQSQAMLGIHDDQAVQANFDRMRWNSDNDRIACPLLVLHGGSDPLVQLEDQQPFANSATTPDVTFKIWSDGEHTIYNHASERTALVADWFASRLSANS